MLKNRFFFICAILLITLMSVCSYGQELRPARGLNGKWGFVDEAGKEVISFKYKDAGKFSEGFASIKNNDGWGFIDKNGKEITQCKYFTVSEFWEGLARVQGTNLLYGFIDKSGKEIIPIQYLDVSDFSEGLVRVSSFDKDGFERWGFIDKKGNRVIQIKYFDAGDFHEGLARVNFNGKWGFIDKTGFEVIPFMYNSAEDFKGEIARVKYKRIWGFIDKTGKVVVQDISNAKLNDSKPEVSPIISTTKGQDIITLQNGDEIEAKVTEISQTEIKYKRFDNLEGPTRIIASKDVFAINYANGTREVINPVNSKKTTQTTNYQQPKTVAGIKGGVNFADLNGFSKSFVTNNEGTTKPKTGFQIGIISETTFKNQNFAFIGGISYSQIGTILEYSESAANLTLTKTAEITIHTLHFSPQFQYKNKVIFLQMGLYTNYHLKTNIDYKMTLNGKKIDEDRESFFSISSTSYDLGLALGAGFVIGGICHIGAGYDMGLKTSNLSLTMTLMFGK